MKPRRFRRADLALAASALLLVAALSPPVDRWSTDLFVAHMAQHLVIVSVVPLLAVMGGLPARVRAALPPSVVRRVVVVERRVLAGSWSILGAATAVHVAGMWAFHAPPVYDATIGVALLHAAEHLVLLGGGMTFWWVALESSRQRGAPAAVMAIFVAALATGALAALITFAPSPSYDGHREVAGGGGINALEDQQMGGALMWAVGGAVYVVAAAGIFARWLRAEGRRTEVLEAARAPSTGRGVR